MARRKQQSTFERLTSGKLNRKQRKELIRRIEAEDPGLEIVYRNAAGIDVGNESHMVSVPAERDARPIREFGSWTKDLQEMADWLKDCGIECVVMQSTGVYWIPLYDVLEKRGFQVCLTNARDTKNLPGRKSDVAEAQWLRRLYSYGLLRNSFRPPEQIRSVRSLWRLRDRHVKEAAEEIQHMQKKALTQMNVQLANAISDISGASGQAIIRAILQGERDPYQLADLRNYRVRATREEIARSLEGTWSEDHLFELQQAVDRYDFCQRQMGECDRRLQVLLAGIPDAAATAPEPEIPTDNPGGQRPTSRQKREKKARRNQPLGFNLEAELKRICGVDLTRIDGVKVMTAQTFLSEVGLDMSPFPSEDHLVSWLNLSPKRSVSGGKLLKHERVVHKNRAANALRMAASTLRESDSYLGARFRALRARLGEQRAIKAMAAYLARLIYRMLTKGQEWVDRGTEDFEKRRQARLEHTLKCLATKLGFHLLPAA